MALRADTIREFGELFERDEPPRAQTHRAVVTAVDGGTVYVDVSGNGDTTPIETTSAGYAIGDEVQVEQRGGRLHVSGNVTQPSVGAHHVEQAVAPVAKTAAQAQSASESAQRVATEAAEVANAVNQHFFSDTDGVHVTEAEQEEWTSSHSGKNILINSLGILLRNALNNLVSITASAIAFFDGSGNSASNVVAQFGASGAQIGKSGAAHSVIDANGQRFYGGSDGTTQLANIGYGEGNTEESGVSTKPYYTFGVRTGVSIGNYSLIEGYMNTSSGYSSHAEGHKTSAMGIASHAQNYGTNAYMHAQTVIGSCNEIESTLVTKSGTAQYGAISTVDIYYAQDVTAVRVDGTELTRDVDYTVIGAGKIAIHNNKTYVSVRFTPAVPVGSTYEIDYIEQKYIFIIGNGSSDENRSNAFMVDWDGYIYPMDEKMADWIVEQGTSGIWTYRKWHSGIAECWGNYTASMAVNVSSAAYGGYRSNEISVNLPSGLFEAWPNTNITFASSNGIWVNNMQPTSATKVGFFLSCGSSQSAASRTVSIQCIGRWK